MDIDVQISGPLLDGQADAILGVMVTELQLEIGDQGLADVQLLLDRQIKHPTPYYETQIESHRAGNDVLVTDRGVIYGPWLEGVGARNARTRFKGYASFRKAFQQLQRELPRLVEPAFRRAVGRLNGA